MNFKTVINIIHTVKNIISFNESFNILCINEDDLINEGKTVYISSDI